MAKTLDLTINANYKGGAAFKKAQTDVKDLEKDSKQAGRGVGDAMRGVAAGIGVAGAAFAAIGLAAKGAFDALNKGAELELAKSRFDNLAASINTTGDALLGKLKEATNGMMSDAALMSSATDMMSLGLAKTEEQAVRMTTVVGKLGWDMQQVVLTMANNSTMRLDALGLSMEDVKTRAKALEDAGYSMDEAFDLAVIEAGEAKIALLGDSANTTAGKIKMLQTAVENAKNAFAATFAGELAGDMGDVGDSAQAMGESLEYAAVGAAKLSAALAGGVLKSFSAVGQSNSMFQLARDLEEMGGDLDAIRQEFPTAFSQGRQNAEAVQGAIEAINAELRQLETVAALSGARMEDAFDPVTQSANELEDAARNARSEWEDWGKVFEDTYDAAKMAAGAIEAAGGQLQGGGKLGQAFGELSDIAQEEFDLIADESRQAAEEAAQAWEEFSDRVSGAFTGAITALQDVEIPDIFSADGASNADAVNTAIYNMGVSAGGTAGQLADLGVATGQFTPQMADAALKAATFQGVLETLSQQWSIGAIDTETFLSSAYEAIGILSQEKPVIEIIADVQEKADGFTEPVRVPVEPDWIGGDPTALTGQTVKIPVDLSIAEGALLNVKEAIDIPESDLQEEFTFTANVDAAMKSKDEVVTAVTEAETVFTYSADAVEAMSAKTDVVTAVNDADPSFEFFADDADVWRSINSINGKRLKVYVDYVQTGSGAAGGVPTGGGSSGGGGGGNSGWGGYGGVNRSIIRQALDTYYSDLARVGVNR